jgi:hypothetical protein
MGGAPAPALRFDSDGLPDDGDGGWWMVVGILVGRAAKKRYRHRIPPSETAMVGAVSGAEFESVPIFRLLRRWSDFI